MNTARIGLAITILLPFLMSCTMTDTTTAEPRTNAMMTEGQGSHHPSRPSGRVTDEDSTASGFTIYETAQVAWDLGQPLTRDQAGLLEGRQTAIFQDLDSPDWLTANFDLPTGQSVSATATTMAIKTDHATGQPNAVLLDTKGLTLDQATERMSDLAGQLEIDLGAVEAWRTSAELRVAGDASVRRTETLRNESVSGPFFAELTAATSLGEDRVTVMLTFTLAS